MILLVADGAPAAVDTALSDTTVERVSTAADARKRSDQPDVVIIHRPTIPDGDDLVEWLRSDDSWDPRVPILVVTDDTTNPDLPLRPYDAIVAADDQSAIEAALDIATSVAGYRDAIDELYQRCLDRAQSGAGPLDVDPDVTDARERADARLEELPDDPELLAALLSDPNRPDR